MVATALPPVLKVSKYYIVGANHVVSHHNLLRQTSRHAEYFVEALQVFFTVFILFYFTCADGLKHSDVSLQHNQ